MFFLTPVLSLQERAPGSLLPIIYRGFDPHIEARQSIQKKAFYKEDKAQRGNKALPDWSIAITAEHSSQKEESLVRSMKL